MAKIRVLRVIQYTYDDTKTMIEDMEHWSVQGTYRPHNRLVIRSTTVAPEFEDDHDDPYNDPTD